MIVLDAADRSLMMKTTVGIWTVSSVISYWSIDSSNVWTPRTFVVAPTSVTGTPSTIILPAPGAGEVSRVVENGWFNLIAPTVGELIFLLDVGGVGHPIAVLKNPTSGAISPDTTFMLGRDGSFTRQEPLYSGTVSLNRNSH